MKKITAFFTPAVFVFFILAYLVPLGARPMLRPDEFRYAEIPREMIVTGDWTVPKLAGVVYFEKPPFAYWTSAVSFKIFGENAFALRLPSALAAALSAIMLYLTLRLARKKGKDDPVPILASAIFLTFGLVYGVGTFAVTDMQMNAALIVTLCSFYLSCDAKKIHSKIAWLVLAGLGAGAAFLTKGFLALAVPACVALPFLIWRKDWKTIFCAPWIPLVAAVIMAIPWALSIYRAEPDFWTYFIQVEHIQRFTSETLDRKAEPFWYFIPVLLGGIMPSGLLAAASWRGWGRKFFTDPLNQFMVCFAVAPFILFSISSCKLGTYILPCFAPLAALIAAGFCEAFAASLEKTEKTLAVIYTAFGAVLVAASVIGMGLALFSGLLKGASWLFYAACAALAAWGLALAFVRGSRSRTFVFLFGMAPALALGLYGLPETAYGKSASGVALRKLVERSPLREGDVILVDRNMLQTAAWELKRADVTLLWRPGELKYAFERYPARYSSRWIEKETDVPERLKDVPVGSRVFFFMRNLKKYPVPSNWGEYEKTEYGDFKMVRF